MIYLIIDMQNDFLSGSLKNEEAVRIVPSIVEDVLSLKEDDFILLTRDTHDQDYLNSMEGKYLPVVHCVKDTKGWEIDSRIENAVSKSKARHRYIDKKTFGYLGFDQAEIKFIIEKQDRIVLVGTCTDICVISNALILKAMYKDKIVQVKKSRTAATSDANQESALNVMKACQVEILD